VYKFLTLHYSILQSVILTIKENYKARYRLIVLKVPFNLNQPIPYIFIIIIIIIFFIENWQNAVSHTDEITK